MKANSKMAKNVGSERKSAIMVISMKENSKPINMMEMAFLLLLTIINIQVSFAKVLNMEEEKRYIKKKVLLLKVILAGIRNLEVAFTKERVIIITDFEEKESSGGLA